MRRGTAAFALLFLAFFGPAQAHDDALPIIEKAFAAAKANEVLARTYVFQERVEERRFGKKGEEKKRQSWAYDVTLLDNSESRRLIARNDEQLDEKAAAKEQRRIDKQIRKMQSETSRQREKRMAKVEKDREASEAFLEEITKAFDFRLIGEEEIGGVATHVISAEPKTGYEPPSREAKVLTRLRATLWISKDGHAWVKADMATFDDITWAVVLKLREGARIGFTQRLVDDEVWMIDSWYVRLRAKMALVLRFDRELTGSYSNFQRFTTDSAVAYGEEVH